MTTFPIEVTVARLVEFHELADWLCQVELGRLPTHTTGDPVAEMIYLAAMQGQTGPEIQAWLHDAPEAIAYRTKPAHKDPTAWSIDALLKVRGSLGIKLNVPWGPRPNQDDNIAAPAGLESYDVLTQARILQACKERGYTHAAAGPYIDPGYHGQYPSVDFRNDPSVCADVLQRFWDADICPIVFVAPDNWSIEQLRTLEPIYRSAQWQALCRVVCYGWEPQGSVYGWSNAEYLARGAWLMDVFPNAVRLLHTISGVEAPVGQGDDTSRPGMSVGDCWQRVAKVFDGWLRQGDELFHPDHVDPPPNGNGQSDYQNWRWLLWDRTNPGSLVGRFHGGTHGYPTVGAHGWPFQVYHGEGWIYDMYWKNTSEEQGREYGKEAVALGADGSLDGWKP